MTGTDFSPGLLPYWFAVCIIFNTGSWVLPGFRKCNADCKSLRCSWKTSSHWVITEQVNRQKWASASPTGGDIPQPEGIFLPSWTSHPPLCNTREVFQSLSRMEWGERGLAVMVSGTSWLCRRVGIGNATMMGGGRFGLQSVSRGLSRSSLALTEPFADGSC